MAGHAKHFLDSQHFWHAAPKRAYCLESRRGDCKGDSKGGDGTSRAQILSSPHYPLRAPRTQSSTLPHTLALGLGSNLAYGARSSIAILESALLWLNAHPRIQILCSSPIWRNPPFGYTAQGDFYNAVLICATSLSVVEVYGLIFYVERRFARGRKREFKNAPRTLDIDLLLYDSLSLKRPYLHIPHRFYTSRPSVMLPLSFLL